MTGCCWIAVVDVTATFVNISPRSFCPPKSGHSSNASFNALSNGLLLYLLLWLIITSFPSTGMPFNSRGVKALGQSSLNFRVHWSTLQFFTPRPKAMIPPVLNEVHMSASSLCIGKSNRRDSPCSNNEIEEQLQLELAAKTLFYSFEHLKLDYAAHATAAGY